MDLIDLFHKSMREPLNKREMKEIKQLKEDFPYFCLPYFFEAKKYQRPENTFVAAAYAPNRGLLREYLESTTIFLHMHQEEQKAPEPVPSPPLEDFPDPISTLSPIFDNENRVEEEMGEVSGNHNELFSVLDYPSSRLSPNGYAQPFSIDRPRRRLDEHLYLQQIILEKSTKFTFLFPLIRQQLQSFKAKLLASEPVAPVSPLPEKSLQETTVAASPDELADMFDSFLQSRSSRPRPIPTPSVENPVEMDHSLEADDDLVSETLAKIHLKQGNNAEAIRIYKKLILVFPEKKPYFVDQIEKIEQIS